MTVLMLCCKLREMISEQQLQCTLLASADLLNNNSCYVRSRGWDRGAVRGRVASRSAAP